MFFDEEHIMLNPPVSYVPPERIFFGFPFGLQVLKRGKEGVLFHIKKREHSF